MTKTLPRNLRTIEYFLLEEIALHRVTDDANLTRPQMLASRFLYEHGLISACPLEGSDTAVDALDITDAGLDLLRDAGILPDLPRIKVNNPYAGAVETDLQGEDPIFRLRNRTLMPETVLLDRQFGFQDGGIEVARAFTRQLQYDTSLLAFKKLDLDIQKLKAAEPCRSV